MPFEQYPYTNFHDLNLDWIIRKMKELENKIDELEPPYTEYYGKIVNVIEEGVKTDGTNQSGKIQNIINDNPNKVIYFPDGEYILDEPIMTSASADKRVILLLSEYATLKASDVFPAADFMVQIGSLDTFDYNNGIPLGIIGGIINCNFRASGIKVEHCHMACIRNMVLRNVAYTGIQVDKRSNINVSSDAQIENVIVYGQLYNATNTGLLLNGYDNNVHTFRTMHTGKGIVLNGGGNTIIDAHPLCSDDSTFANYGNTVGFEINSPDNHLSKIYADNFSIGLSLNYGRNIISDYTAFWYGASNGKVHAAIKGNLKGSSIIGLNVTVPSAGDNYIYLPTTPNVDSELYLLGEQGSNNNIVNNVSNMTTYVNLHNYLADYGLLDATGHTSTYFDGAWSDANTWIPVGIFAYNSNWGFGMVCNVTCGRNNMLEIISDVDGVKKVNVLYGTATYSAVLTEVTNDGHLPTRILWIKSSAGMNANTKANIVAGYGGQFMIPKYAYQHSTVFKTQTTLPGTQIGNIVTN